jgi:hypothetical protein
MRAAIFVIGLLLIGAGAAIGFGNFRYPDETSVVKVGNLSATLTRERPIPHWLGAVTALTGLLIVGLGTRYRR